MIHKSSYSRGYVKKTIVRKWLQLLEDKPLYRLARIKIDWDRLNEDTSADGFDEGVTFIFLCRAVIFMNGILDEIRRSVNNRRGM